MSKMPHGGIKNKGELGSREGPTCTTGELLTHNPRMLMLDQKELASSSITFYTSVSVK